MPIHRPETHVTGDSGERIFAAEIPAEWVPDKPTRDYGIDSNVLVPEAHLITAMNFAAQVKTAPRHPRVKGEIRVGVEVDHLVHWLDEETRPVFLVACDRADRALFFADVDDLQERLPAAWRDQKTVTVSVQPADSVQNHPRFLAAVRRAWARRSGPQAALRRRQRQLEKLDPRFNVLVSATAAGEMHELIPRESVAAELHVSTVDKSKLERLVRGHRVTFAPGEARMTQMPLFEGLTRHGGSVEISARHEALMSLVATRGELSASLRNLPVAIVIALNGFRCEASLPGSPLSVSIEGDVPGLARVDPSELPEYVRVCFGAELDPSAWFGGRLRDLQHFAELHAFFSLCEKGAEIDTVFHLPGRDVPLTKHAVDRHSVAGPWELIELVRLAREVAGRAEIDPVLPATLNARDAAAIRRAHALLFSDEYRAPGRTWVFTATLSKDATRFPSRVGDFSIKMKRGHAEPIPFLGETVRCTVYETILTKARVTKRRRLATGGSRVTLGSEDGEFIQRARRPTG